jgi:hypothetical protein
MNNIMNYFQNVKHQIKDYIKNNLDKFNDDDIILTIFNIIKK